MQRPHIPKLAFAGGGGSHSGPAGRPGHTAPHLAQQPFAVQGYNHAAAASAASAAAPSFASPARAAPASALSPSSRVHQQWNSSSTAASRQQRDEHDEADEDSQPVGGGESAYTRAAALLDHSSGSSSSNEEDEDAVGSALVRRPLVDAHFTFEDSEPSARVLHVASGAGGASSRRSGRGAVPGAAEQLASATAPPVPAARSRLDRGSLRTWQTTALQMKQRGELMEREHLSWLASRRAWFAPGSDELAQLAELDRMVLDSGERVRRERDTLLGEMRRIKSLVSRFSTHVGAPSDADAYVAQLRLLLESIEEALASFKNKAKEKYGVLHQAEKELSTELDAMLVGFERWTETDDVVGATNGTPAKAKKSKAGSSLHPVSDLTAADDDGTSAAAADAADIRVAIARLEEVIEADGGATGGWDPRDHAHYLKLRTQVGGGAKNDPAFLARLVGEISDQTPASALAHVEWHERWLGNIATKKQLIAQWKKTKLVKDADGVQEEIERQQEAEKEERKQIADLLSRDRAEKAAAVAEWKAQKQAREDTRQEKIQAAKDEKEARLREKQEDERRRLRSMVEAYQEEKAVEQLVSSIQAQPTARELSEREREDREARRRLREKHEAQLRAVREKREAKVAETARATERAQMLAKASAAPATQRNPSRLTQPTAIMLERAKQREAEEAALVEYQRTHGGRTPSTMLARPSMGHTATPAWRKGV